MKSKFPTIPSYISSFPKPVQVKLRQMRACVRVVAPKATEGLKWGMIAFSYRRILVIFGGFKHHIGFYPTPSAVKKFAKELSGFKTARGSIQFPLDSRYA